MKCHVVHSILQSQNDFEEIKEELTEKDKERQGWNDCEISTLYHLKVLSLMHHCI
jgi:hypothetical protein